MNKSSNNPFKGLIERYSRDDQQTKQEGDQQKRNGKPRIPLRELVTGCFKAVTESEKSGDRRPAWKVAAVFVIFLMLFGFSQWRRLLSYPGTARTFNQTTRTIGPGHYQTMLLQPDGSRQVMDSNGSITPFNLQLPDNSIVRLSYGSSLRFAECFDSDCRAVWLYGQASFEVLQNDERPFMVHFGNTAVRVLGTRFNVLSYADEMVSEVTLLSGKVQVIHGQEVRLLKPTEQAVIHEDGVYVRKLSHPERVIGWMDKEAYCEFDSVDLLTVIRRVARMYGLNAAIGVKAKGTVITGIFSLKDPLDTNLKRIGAAERGYARVKRRGDSIFVTRDFPRSKHPK